MKKSLADLLNGVAAPAEFNDNRFFLASYNMRGPFDKSPNEFYGDRLPKIVQMIKKYDMDIIGTQELVPETRDALLAQLPGYTFVGVPREDGKAVGEGCFIIYKTERFDAVDSDSFWLSETPDVPGSRSWDSWCTRVCTMLRFKDKQTGKEFVHVNTHLDHHSEEARIKGIQLIVAEIKRRYKEPVPMILTGDFNTYIGTPTHDAASALLTDSFTSSETSHVGPFRTFTNWIWEEKENLEEGSRIDFIFVSDEVKVKEIVTCNDTFEGNTYSSDHHPVVSALVI